MIERRFVSEVRASRDGRTLRGYAARFNEPSLDLDGFTEVIERGAFRDSLRDRPDVVLLHSHDSSRPLARTTAGTLKLREDRRGLSFEATVPNSAEARHILLLVEQRVLTGMSIGFMVRRAEDESWEDNRSGSVVRTLHRVTLIEASTVTWPAYPTTSVDVASVRSMNRSRQIPQRKELMIRLLMQRLDGRLRRLEQQSRVAA